MLPGVLLLFFPPATQRGVAARLWKDIMVVASAATSPSSRTSCRVCDMVSSRQTRRPMRAGHRRRTCARVSASSRHTMQRT